MTRRAVLVHLQPFDIHSRMVYLPYLCATLRAYAEQDPAVKQGWRFAEPVWRLRDLDVMLDEVGEPDLLGVSAYMWNHRNSLRLARAVKERFPRCIVVFGGPHLPGGPSDYLERHPWVDVLVHGEGEASFAGLLREALADPPDWDRVPGLSFRRDGAQRFTGPAPQVELDFPGPYAAGLLDAVLEEVRREVPGVVLQGLLETTRGCPYSCAYCDWGAATLLKLRRFPEDRVMGELDWMARHQIETVVLNDANFGILPRDLGFAERIAELKRRTGFPRSFLPLGFAKNSKERGFAIHRTIQEGDLAVAGGYVNFSLQSMSQATLDAIHRKNIPLDSYRVLADRSAREGYRLVPDLILPLPGETLASFQEGYADLASWSNVDRIMLYPCAVLPNAPMAAPEYRSRWGMQTRMVPLPSHRAIQLEARDAVDEEMEALVATSTMTEEEAAEARCFALLVDALEFAGLARELRRAMGLLRGLSPGAFYTSLVAWQLEHRGLLSGVLEQVRAAVLEHPESPLWGAFATTAAGQEALAAQALLADGLADPDRLAWELRVALEGLLLQAAGALRDGALQEAAGALRDGALQEAAGALRDGSSQQGAAREGLAEEIADLVRYQRDRWIPLDYDPRVEKVCEYAFDWISLLEGGGPLERRPLRLRYRPRPEWLESALLGTPAAWWAHSLAPGGLGYACIHAEAERDIL